MLSRLINQASHKGLRIKVGRPTLSVFSTIPEGRGVDPLKTDERTQKSQEEANATDDATKDSIKHAAEGNMKEALKDIGEMAKNAATGAAQSAKLSMGKRTRREGWCV